MKRFAVALVALVAAVGCTPGNFKDVTELRHAAVKVGLTCPVSGWKLIDAETGACGNGRVVQMNETNHLTVPLAQDGVNAGQLPPSGILVSEHWVIYAPWPEVLMIQDELGGNATNLQVQR